MGDATRIDALISDHARSWALDRMPVVDRQLLRVATFEILSRPDVPCAVIIDEAIELAKEYSTEESGRFVNGILAALSRELRPDEAVKSPADVTAPLEGDR
jgi:N utilization substance protein B